VEALKSLVLEVESFLTSIAHSVMRDVKDDMAMAIKGIVTVRKPPKPKQRLNVKIDDDFEYLCEESEHRAGEGDDNGGENDV
jgi:hypothetical protein